MSDMAEDRIYEDRAERVDAYVASAVGVVVVSLSGNRVGRFRIDRRGTATDVAGGDGRVVVATPDDVLVGSLPEGSGTDNGGESVEYAETGFGTAVAVGVDAGDVIAAGPDGAIGRRVEGEWLEIAAVDGDVRAVDGGFLAASDGLYRATPDGLDYVGLDDARDVAAAGPYAATDDGLYELGNGWIRVVEGTMDAVTATDGRAHAAGECLLARVDGEWRETPVTLPGRVAGVARAVGTYAVTHDGTVLAHPSAGLDDADDPGAVGGWRTRTLGVTDVGGIAIPGTPTGDTPP